MNVRNAKDAIVEAVQALPPDASIDDAMERLYILAKTEKGLAQIESGDTVSHEEAKKRLLN